jgi:hypothetical protein
MVIFDVWSENHNYVDNINTLCGRSADVLNAKAGGKYSNCCSLKGFVRQYSIENKTVLKILSIYSFVQRIKQTSKLASL